MRALWIGPFFCLVPLFHDGERRDRLPEPVGREQGAYGTVHPQPAAVLLDAAPVHADAEGGCEQALLDLAAAPTGGYAAVWRDTRDGHIGLYLGRLDAAGRPTVAEVPAYDRRGTARQLVPALTVGGDMRGALVWVAGSRGQPALALHVFAARGPTRPGPKLEAARGLSRQNAAAPRFPAACAGPDGRVLVAWQTRDLIWTQTVGAKGRVAGAVRSFDASGALAEPMRLGMDAQGRALSAWSVADGFRVCELTEDGARPSPIVGPGRPLAVRADATEAGGWWVLAQEGSELALYRVAGNEAEEPLHPVSGAVEHADLAVWRFGLAIAVVRADALEIHFVTGDGCEPFGPTLRVPAADGARDLRIASSGPAAESMLVAWTERNGGAAEDVRTALLSMDGNGGVELSEPRTWNTDVASSRQQHGSAASNGEELVVAWRDERDGQGRVRLRKLGADGAWRLEDRLVTEGERGTMQRPATAILSDGGFLVLWMEEDDGSRWRLMGRAFSADGAPLGPAARVDPDPGHELAPNAVLDAVALAGDAGYAAVWVRADGVPVARRLETSGAPVGEVWALGDDRADNPSIARLDDGRLICVWDRSTVRNPDLHRLAGRFLAPDVRPIGDVLAFDVGAEKGDIDPSAAPGPGNGFVLAWTTRDCPARDIVARFFDAEGSPEGLPLAISVLRNEQDYSDIARLTDGSWVVVWEDDISGYDHIHARRIAADGRSVGPTVTLDPRTAEVVEARHAPCVVPLGSGFATLWGDSSRSKGADVFLRYLGPSFDDLDVGD
ncbi:MAG: hypothetical protein O7B99_03985 [Planctomycetota bacterium]|nr:hypothetical protein [Planctomycetota bacterium]